MVLVASTRRRSDKYSPHKRTTKSLKKRRFISQYSIFFARYTCSSDATTYLTNHADSFLILNISCRMLPSRLSEIDDYMRYDYLPIMKTCNRRSVNMRSWTFVSLCSVLAVFGIGGRSSSEIEMQPCWNSLSKLLASKEKNHHIWITIEAIFVYIIDTPTNVAFFPFFWTPRPLPDAIKRKLRVRFSWKFCTGY